jgi:hypothetical protein
MKKLLATAALGMLAIAGVADAASARDGDVRVAGRCDGRSTSKLKLGPRPSDGVIETEFEVDSNVVGQTWQWRFRQNGVIVARGSRVTQAPSGSFTVRRRLADNAGTDTIVAVGVNPATGETCRATASV